MLTFGCKLLINMLVVVESSLVFIGGGSLLLVDILLVEWQSCDESRSTISTKTKKK
jgi:hypothetical protein